MPRDHSNFPDATRSNAHWDLALNGMRRCWTTLDRFEGPVSHRLFELAEVGPSGTVLDIATGIGEPALTIAKRQGPGGRVIAIDQSEALLEFARARARDAGISTIEFRRMDADALDLADRSVQSIVCRWGLMFLRDLPAALGRMRRILEPRGRLAAAVWSAPENVPVIPIRRKVMVDFNLEPAAVNPFSLSSQSALRGALGAAGFDDLRIETSNVPYAFGSVAEYVDHQRLLHGSRLVDLQKQSPERQAAFWSALGAKAQPYVGSDGIVSLPSEIILVSGRA